MIKPWSYRFSDGTFGCVMAGSKTTAIMTIIELNPSRSLQTLSITLAPEWTLNPPCVSPAVNTYQTQKH